jgi:hypothetical protein
VSHSRRTFPANACKRRKTASSAEVRFREVPVRVSHRVDKRPTKEIGGTGVLWFLVLILIVLAVAGGVALSPFIFLLLLLALVFALVAARA